MDGVTLGTGNANDIASTWRAASDAADAGATVGAGAAATSARLQTFNGTTWERQRSNLSGISLAALAAAGAGANGTDQVNYSGKGLHIVIDITALAGTTPTLTVTLQGKDPISGKYYTILASAALNAVATTVLRVYPGLVAAANLTANDVLPRDWRVIYAIGGSAGQAVTATIAAAVID